MSPGRRGRRDVTPVATSRVQRAAARRARQQEHRRRTRRTVAAVAAGLVAIAVVVAVALVVSNGTTHHKHTASVRTQSTVLFQLRGARNAAAESALLAYDSSTADGVALLVPARVIVDVPGRGSMPFGSTLGIAAPALSRASLSDLLGVSIDASWVVDARSLAAIVDRLGGITTDVDTDVLAPQRGGGARVVVSAGKSERLNGTQAVAFAEYTAPGENEVQQAPRLQAVLDAILAELPSQANAVTPLVSGRGQVDPPRPTLLMTLLAGLSKSRKAGNLTYHTLDVVPIDTTGSNPAYRIDATAVHTFVNANLAASIPAGARPGATRVFVEARRGTSSAVVLSIRNRLTTAGLRYVGSGTLTKREARSVVLVFQDTPAANQLGARVAVVLGLPVSAVRFSAQGQSVADVIVLLGPDYRP